PQERPQIYSGTFSARARSDATREQWCRGRFRPPLRGACLRPEDTIEGLVADVPKLRHDEACSSSSREDLGSSGAKGDEGCFYAVARFSLPQDRGNVHLDGDGSEVQRFRDLSVRLSLAEPDQDLSLASREAFDAFDGARVLGVRRRADGVEQTPGDRGREERAASGDGVHTGDQLARIAGVEDKPVCVEPDGLGDVVVLPERGDEQAGERAPVGAEPLQRVESAHPGHLDVEEGDVETVRVDLAQGLCSVGGLGYDLDGGIGVEDPDDAGPHEGVVVGDQDSDRGLGRCHRCPPAMYSVLETSSCAKQIRYTSPAASSKVFAVTA